MMKQKIPRNYPQFEIEDRAKIKSSHAIRLYSTIISG